MPLSHAPCPMPHVPCPMPRVPCPLSLAPCPYFPGPRPPRPFCRGPGRQPVFPIERQPQQRSRNGLWLLLVWQNGLLVVERLLLTVGLLLTLSLLLTVDLLLTVGLLLVLAGICFAVSQLRLGGQQSCWLRRR